MATSRRVGNYATSANAVAKSTDQIFEAAMSGRPDFTAISKEAIKGRSLERRTAMEAEGQVAKAGIQALNKVKQTKIKADTAKEVTDIKRPARRMAGILGGLGTLATTGAMMVQDKRDKAEEAEARVASDARYVEQERKLTELLERGKADNTETIEPFKPEPFPEFKPSSSAGAAVSSTDGTPRSVSSSSQKMTQSQMTELLVSEGMPRADAIIGGAVGMAESGGKSDARSHPDLERETGEMSVGLWQHNKNTGEDRHGFYGIQDWGELNNPKTNARATYRLWKRRGGWDDWGAYTNGSYSQFMPK